MGTGASDRGERKGQQRKDRQGKGLPMADLEPRAGVRCGTGTSRLVHTHDVPRTSSRFPSEAAPCLAVVKIGLINRVKKQGWESTKGRLPYGDKCAEARPARLDTRERHAWLRGFDILVFIKNEDAEARTRKARRNRSQRITSTGFPALRTGGLRARGSS